MLSRDTPFWRVSLVYSAAEQLQAQREHEWAEPLHGHANKETKMPNFWRCCHNCVLNTALVAAFGLRLSLA